jgi:hypothetical protein
VIDKRIQTLWQSRGKRGRIVALILLASLAWATTAEFTHHHGAQSANSFIKLLPGSSHAEGSNEGVSRLKSSDRESHSSTNSSADCAICQLHQNLSSTLFNSPPRVETVDTRVLSAPPQFTLKLSKFSASQQGRAPPVNL